MTIRFEEEVSIEKRSIRMPMVQLPRQILSRTMDGNNASPFP